MIKILFSTIFFISLSIVGFSQQNLEKQIIKPPTYDESIVDSIYGITLYEPLNISLKGDSVRMKRGYAVNGWIEDFYTNGKMLHRGYYIEGQLKIYKNFYPNGNLEREFANIDNFRSKLTLYYPDGSLKSQVKYMEGYPKLWIDYFPNGKMEYYEEYHRNLIYHIAKRTYYDNEQAASLMELTHKKKLTYSLNEYYKNGGVKLKGYLVYSKKSYDYKPTGTWIYYNTDGSESKEEKYIEGKLKK